MTLKEQMAELKLKQQEETLAMKFLAAKFDLINLENDTLEGDARQQIGYDLSMLVDDLSRQLQDTVQGPVTFVFMNHAVTVPFVGEAVYSTVRTLA
jgi:hypothetical protein